MAIDNLVDSICKYPLEWLRLALAVYCTRSQTTTVSSQRGSTPPSSRGLTKKPRINKSSPPLSCTPAFYSPICLSVRSHSLTLHATQIRTSLALSFSTNISIHDSLNHPINSEERLYLLELMQNRSIDLPQLRRMLGYIYSPYLPPHLPPSRVRSYNTVHELTFAKATYLCQMYLMQAIRGFQIINGS